MNKHPVGKNPNSRNGFKKGHRNYITDIVKKKISTTLKGNTNARGSTWHHSTEAKKKIGDAARGEGNWNWKGGISGKYKLLKAGPRPDNCQICGRSANESKNKMIFYDHCHQTGKFRGWLCNQCNVALGCVKDNVVILERMIVYLKQSKEL